MPVNEPFRIQTLTVERVTRTFDGAGGWIEALTPIGEITGSLQPLSGTEVVNADEHRADVRWVFYADLGSDVARGDELVLVDGRRWRVLFVGDWDDGSELDHLRVDLEEVQRGR